MTGLEKMKSQILDEAKAAADSKVSEARAQAAKIVCEAKDEAEKSGKSILQKSQAEVKGYQERIASSIDLQRRTKILEAKQKLIREVLEKALESMESMEREEYFSKMLGVLEKYALPQEGKLFFSEKDLADLPAGFEAEVERIASEKGGKLTVSKEGRKIQNGFILAYGGIEENCTLSAMFDAKKDELSDKIQHILFS